MPHLTGIQVNDSARTVAELCSRPMDEPLAQEPLDFFVPRHRMTPAEVLTHQIEPSFKQVQCRAERVGHRLGIGLHRRITAAANALGWRRNHSSAGASVLALFTQAPGRFLAVDRRHAAAFEVVVPGIERLSERGQFLQVPRQGVLDELIRGAAGGRREVTQLSH